MAKAPRPVGRPPIYNKEVADEILLRLSQGETLRKICKSGHLPSDFTVRSWCRDDLHGFAAAYTRARDIGLDARADRIIELADSAIGQSSEYIQAMRLRIDVEKWYLSKMAPKRYGDRIQVDADLSVRVESLDDEELNDRILSLMPTLALAA